METAIIAALIACFINLVLCPLIIPVLRRVKFGQNVRDDGPADHIRKTGTPTMGGIIIISGFLGGSLWFFQNSYSLILIFITLAFGFIGFLDDYIKVVKKRSLGLRVKQKLLLQLLVGGVFVAFLHLSANDYRIFFVPFMEEYINTGFLFIPVALFIILGTVNSVNLTDGLDGLAGSVTLIVTVFFLIVAGREITPIIGAFAGSLLGFLVFNVHPAKVFMGDTGSLALGGFVAGIALILQMPLFLVIVGLVYVLETLSVILQVVYFKKTGGKRLFKMAPLHHHFELKGLPETKVTALFCIFTIIMCLIGFLSV